MNQPRIVDRGDGPKIQGTRITVYTIYEYLKAGRSRDWMAVVLGLSSRQVQAAMDYIREHEAEVRAEHEKIMERIRKGNPTDVEERLRANREKLRQRLSEQRTVSK